jgi:endonuclease YncB( thermonuclease family)
LLFASIALALVLAASASASPTESQRLIATGVVASITDGDTLRLANGSRIRLLQIDTPELGSGECYSRAARTELLRLAPVGSRIVLEADPHLDKVDRYGRLLRYVKRKGVNVNIQLVLRGAAAPYFYRSERGKYASRLVAAVTRAKANKKGLWRACPGTQLTMTGPLQTRQGTGRPPPTTNPGSGACHPSYKGSCLDPNASDYDCEGGSGNGPLYTGRVQVVGKDVYGLDGDGIGCE